MTRDEIYATGSGPVARPVRTRMNAAAAIDRDAVYDQKARVPSWT